MAEAIALVLYLSLWVGMAAYLGYHARGRDSKYWLAHVAGSLALGFIYVAAYALHVKFSAPANPQPA